MDSRTETTSDFIDLDLIAGTYNDLIDLADPEVQRDSFLKGRGRMQLDFIEFIEQVFGGGYSIGTAHYQPEEANRVLGEDIAERLRKMNVETPSFGYQYDVTKLWDDPRWQSIMQQARDLLLLSPYKEMYEKHGEEYAPFQWELEAWGSS